MKCNRDCFNCKYKDCIEDEVCWADYVEIESRKDREPCESDKGGWNFRHPEKIAEYKKRYLEKNREELKRKSLEYYHANRERILERNKTDYIRDYKKMWARKKRAKAKEMKCQEEK